jgi:hypothetical protein
MLYGRLSGLASTGKAAITPPCLLPPLYPELVTFIAFA